MTERLYYKDAYLTEFDAAVTSCEADGKVYKAEFDRTAFYPEGGGQPCDLGEIFIAESTSSDVHAETGTVIRVLDVQEEDGHVVHTLDAPVAAGTQIHGKIDWERRFDHMQQHSGEHIVSGMICKAFNCDNVGFHMNEELVTIDYNTEITFNELLKIEKQANSYIWENHPVVITVPSAEELKTIEYRSKKELEGDVRIVSFPGADTCACCGLHVKLSGEIGIVKFTSVQKFKGGVRIELYCGGRAAHHLCVCHMQNKAVAQLLSAKDENTFEMAVKMQNELQETKQTLASFEENYYKAVAETYRDKGDVLLIHAPLRGDGVRRLADALSTACGGMAAVFAGENGEYKYAVIHKDHDISSFIKEMNQVLNGRGGGRNGFAQGSCAAAAEEIRKHFK